MRGLGFEPRYALSNVGLNDARLTTPASPLNIAGILGILNLYMSVYNPKVKI